MSYFLANYEEFSDLFTFLENKKVTLIEKQQKFHAFEKFLIKCEILTGNERKFALSNLHEILGVKYDSFVSYQLHGELIIKCSPHQIQVVF